MNIKLSGHLVNVRVIPGLSILTRSHRVAARLVLALTTEMGACVNVDHHVGQVDAHYIVWVELFQELAVSVKFAFRLESRDCPNRLLLRDLEREHHVRHRAIGNLLINR